MEEFNAIIRGIHIASGAVSLFSGLLALGLSLNPTYHKRVGKVFFYAMTLVFVTAVYLSIVQEIQFLFAVAILSFFSTFHAVRAMQFWKGSESKWFDWVSLILLILCGGYLLSRGVIIATDGMGFEVLLHLVFGSFMLILGYTSSRDLLRNKPYSIAWFKAHRGNMSGALIATITAFCTTSLTFLPAIVAWFGPALILSPILAILIKRSDKWFNVN